MFSSRLEATLSVAFMICLPGVSRLGEEAVEEVRQQGSEHTDLSEGGAVHPVAGRGRGGVE